MQILCSVEICLFIHAEKELYMHIKSSLYHAMRRISNAFVNALPSRCSTLHHKVRVVKSTQNVPREKPMEWPSRVKFPPVEVEVHGLAAKAFTDPMTAGMRQNKERKAAEKGSTVSDAISTGIVTPASPSSLISASAPAGPTIDSHVSHVAGSDLIRPGQAEPEWVAPASLPLKKEKSYITQITIQAEVHGKPGKKRAAPQPPTASRTAESVAAENVLATLPPQTWKDVPQRIALRPLKNVCIEPVRNSSLYIKRGPILPSLEPIPEYPLPTPPPESNHELYAVFARRRTKEAIAKAAQSIAELESRRGLAVPAQRPGTDEIDFQRYVIDDDFSAEEAYMRDPNNRLMLDKNGEMVI
jgi:hypothetical protein